MHNTNRLANFCQKAVFVLANLLLIVTPFVFTGVNEELFEFNKILLVYGGTTLIVSCWLVRMIAQKKIIFRRSFLDLPLLAFLFTQLISTFFSIHPRTSVFGYYTRFHGGFLSTLTYCLLFWALVSNASFKQLKALLVSAVLAAVGVSLYAIPERLGVSPSCMILRQKFDTNCWKQDVRSRVFATFGQPNWLAAYLAMILPLAAGFYLQLSDVISKKFLTRLIDKSRLQLGRWLKKRASLLKKGWLVGVGLMLTALLMTKSRSGLIGFLTGGGTVLVGAGVLVFRYYYSNQRKSLINLLITFLLIMLALGTNFTPSLGKLLDHTGFIRFSSLSNHKFEQPTTQISPTGILITPSEDIRLVVWQGALRVWQRYPWLGSGPETFAYSYYLDRPSEHNLLSEWDFLYNKAHNELLNFLATTGVVGLAGYLALVLTSFVLATKLAMLLLSQKNQTELYLVLGITGGMLAFHLTNWFGFSTVMVSVLWMIYLAYLAALELSLKKNSKKGNQVSSHAKSTKKTKLKQRISLIQTISLVGVFIISAHLLLSILSTWQADYLYVKGKNYILAAEYQSGIEFLQRAIMLSPNEALFYDELAHSYALVAVELVKQDEVLSAQEYAEAAIEASNQTLTLNPHHLNFRQTRATIFSKLAQVDASYLEKAKQTLLEAQEMAPTHPKLIYHQGLIELSLGEDELAEQTFLTAIQMKPNYHEARFRLGQFYETNKKCELAKEQYQYILENIIPNDFNLKEKLEKLDC